MFLTTSIILPPISAIALLLNRHYIDDKDTFPEFTKQVFSDFSVSKTVWETLNDDKSELLRLGYQPE